MVESKHSRSNRACVSIESGIYLPGRFGARIEDIATVTKHGGRRLNNTSHEMRIVS